MTAKDIYNFRRKLKQANLYSSETKSNIISELVDLVDYANFLINHWTRTNIDIIRNEKN